MASDIDICNLALGHLGDEANVQAISPPDGTAQAQHCARFYPIARDATLEMHAWGFALKRESLAQLTTPSTTAWAYQYAVPTDMIKPLNVYPADADYASGAGDDDNKQPYLREGDVILTNNPNAMLRYVSRITDPTRFTPLFVETFGLKLAARLAGPIIKGTTGMNVAKEMAAAADKMLAHATASDANAGNYQPEHQPDWLSARQLDIPQAQHGTVWRR
jgi:hypothetical protein